MTTKNNLQIVGGLSKPSKMPGWAYGLPAPACKTGSKLRDIPNSTCSGCYAMKGCYVFPVVQAAQYRRLGSIKSIEWVDAMAELINSKKSKYFRWHDSGDVQDEAHLMKIFEVCELTPGTQHWMPTREAWVKKHLQHCPKNLVIRFSPPMVNQRAPESWPNSSMVVDKGYHTCPAPAQGGKCLDCRQCWDPDIKVVSYGKH